jgi:uronate dehydrogenase
VVGHSVIYGVSDNQATWWDNTPARHIGYRPQDSSESFRTAVESRQPTLDGDDPATRFQGGVFVRSGPFD